MDIKSHWQDVLREAQTLPEEVALITIERRDLRQPGGVHIGATRINAARLIVSGTHRQATVEEAAAFEAKEAAERKRLKAVAMQESGRYIMTMTPEQLAKISGEELKTEAKAEVGKH